jgi:anaerobic magnesium-protoporphyrin IX monomethyl ester cyclase
MPKYFILVARKPPIEPLGLHYLDEVPHQAGWDSHIVLIDNDDFGPLWEAIRERRPDIVGFHVWAGYHLPMLAAAGEVRREGMPVVMGGPYATYAHQACVPYADWVIRASGFGLLREVLDGTLKPGVHFNHKARYEMFPIPRRKTLYAYCKEYGESLIKSIFASVGCPYRCSYCHAPEFNKMHGGFDLIMRPIDDVIAEAKIVMQGWPHTKLFYFQDDVFGFDEKEWLPEFAKRWRAEVGVPFHCQMRLEMTRHDSGDRRLDLFVEAGCTGITLAIESDSEFLRDHVLFRSMKDHLILEGCKKIMDRGMTLRTEQILAVPFSDISTDLGTLDLNNRINPTMAWTSILSPYPGVPIGTIAKNFGLWEGTDDDLKESFFESSVLRHTKNGPRDIERIVADLKASGKAKASPLLRMKAQKTSPRSADIYFHPDPAMRETGSPVKVGSIGYLSDEENIKYCESTVRLHALFYGLAKMPEAKKLGAALVDLPSEEWQWGRIGEVTNTHHERIVPKKVLERRLHSLADEMGLPSPELFPGGVKENPHYFTYFPSGGALAQKVVKQGIFAGPYPSKEAFHAFATVVRRHLFDLGLYKVVESKAPIAT